ncbi:hypothetical protein RFI_24135 [Reticulomyxa filosa]|uniref:Uncharacterized protein n=1 Tax=Reticulomyxa filosa TaxID=46433 RepID=X6MHV3_RETFI|nr:hypothetical protein RFI_24135 [Reticulomyxa filosa]|eukprot:ETO13241.1 hypothetical protein RFI_24135 [Reticulomyxa filosa]
MVNTGACELQINLGECETEEEILDAIEQSRKMTRLIISAVQKGSKFEVSQIMEHYGLPMTSRLHFKVVNVVMEQWVSYFFFSLLSCKFFFFLERICFFSLLFHQLIHVSYKNKTFFHFKKRKGEEEGGKKKLTSQINKRNEEQIFNVLKKNKFAMDKLKQSVSKGTIAVSDLLSEWELPIGALQSKIIRRIQDHFKEEVSEEIQLVTFLCMLCAFFLLDQYDYYNNPLLFRLFPLATKCTSK